MKKINCRLKKNFNNKKCREMRDIGEARFSIILPKSDNSKRPIKPKIIKGYITKVNSIFGGSTTVPVTKGCYYDKNKLQCENGLEITAVRDFQSKYDKSLSKLTAKQRVNRLQQDYAKLKKIAREAGKELGQDSIMVISDYINDSSFISGIKKKRLPSSKVGKRQVFT